MSEWWTYSLGDFLMFAPRTYWRLVELYNAAYGPMPGLLPLAGAAAALAQWRRAATLAVCLFQASVWAWVGWAFHARRYAAINWAAEGFSVAFLVEAALWIAAAGVARRAPVVHPPGAADWRRAIGAGFWLLALAGYPLLGLAAGRPWAQAEVFGLMPDPTVLATLGSLLLWHVHGLPRAWCLGLALVPLAWCVVGGATMLAMHEPTWPMLPVAGLVWTWAVWTARPAPR
jgi:hypothetical protein